MKIFTVYIPILFSFLFTVTVSATASGHTFSDVPSTHQNYEDIHYLLENNIIEPTQTFGPNEIVTREEVTVMVAKAVGLDGTKRATKFSDVFAEHINSGFIQSAAEQGIINGYPDATFKPYVKVTRGHMAAFIARAFELPNGSKTFKDVVKGSTAYEAVQKLAAAHITNGYPDGTFKPNNNLTRAHMAAFLARAHKYYVAKSYEPTESDNPTSNEITPTQPITPIPPVSVEENPTVPEDNEATVSQPQQPYEVDLDYLTDDEKELARLINEYRISLGLAPFKISKSLTMVARSHIIDSNKYSPENNVDERGINCNLHSWSANGKWSSVCYTSDHTYAQNMWDKPRELTSYQGNGYEISAYSSFLMTPALALTLWQNSTGHNDVIIGNGYWSNLVVMGVGIYGNYSHIWFGEEPDPVTTIE